MFLGYSSESKAYRAYDLSKKKTILCRDVIFDETGRLSLEKETITPELVEIESLIEPEEPSEDVPAVEDQPPQPRRSAREHREPDRFGEWAYMSESIVDEPTSVKQALNSFDAFQWKKNVCMVLNSVNQGRFPQSVIRGWFPDSHL